MDEGVFFKPVLGMGRKMSNQAEYKKGKDNLSGLGKKEMNVT